MSGTNGSQVVKVSVIESNVLGAVAYEARCLNCPWKTKRFDGRRGEQKAVELAMSHSKEWHEAKAKVQP